MGGQVLVSDATRQALGDRLLVEGPVEAEGKGLATSLRLWEVLALRGDDALRILPSPVRDLTEIGRPLDAHVRLVLGSSSIRSAIPRESTGSARAGWSWSRRWR